MHKIVHINNSIYLLLFLCCVSISNAQTIDSLYYENTLKDLTDEIRKSLKTAKPKLLNLLNKANSDNYDEGVIGALQGLGLYYIYSADFDNATKILDSSIQIAKKTKNIKLQAFGIISKSIVSYQTNRLQRALQENIEAIPLLEKVKDSSTLAKVLGNIGTLNLDFGNFDIAKTYYTRSKKMALLTGNDISYQLNSFNYCQCFLDEEKKPVALKCFNELFNYLKTSNSASSLRTNTLLESGRLACNPDNVTLDVILNNLKRIESKKDELPRKVMDQTTLYNNFTRYYLIKGDTKNALKYLNKSKKIIGSNHKDSFHQERILKLEASYYEKNGDYKKAFSTYKQFVKLKDSIKNKKSSFRINELNVQYETGRKDNQINLQKIKLQTQENLILKRQRLYSIIFISIGIVLIGLVILLIMYKSKQNLKAQEIKRLKIENDLAKLDAIIEGEEKERKRLAQDLHDGINGNLAALKYKMSSIGDEKISESAKEILSISLEDLDSSIHQIRDISHNLAPPSLLNFHLVKSLKIYCDKISASSNVTIEFYFYGAHLKLNSSTETAIYRIVQELITNITKHAKASNAIVQINHHTNSLHITVEDDGIGFDYKKNKLGMGLKNIQSRVQFLKADLDLVSNEKGTTIAIDIDTTNLKYSSKANYSEDKKE